AAICRKVIDGKYNNKKDIIIWGDGAQTRSFMYIDDCINGILKIMYSDIKVPLNLGSTEMVSINQLTDLAEDIAGYKMTRHYDLDAPKGVRGRNSDNTLILELLKWEPKMSLREGLTKTYNWIEGEMLAAANSDNAEKTHRCNC
ncbi:MAG: NAD-dependent epimerase/dehydratase family protein, partial [Bacteroidota bacterium]|nr:NAD-dependent epimerase/dehydratase family protein [Bacteroidota bacterium]